MRFDLTQTIAAPVDAVAAAYASTEMYEALDGDDRLSKPEVLDRREEGGLVVLRIRYRYVAEMSAAVTAVVDPARLSWIEETRHDLAARTIDVRLLPDHYADRMSAHGTARYRAEGDTTVRRLQGELKVKALLVGGAVEKAIVAGLEEHLAQEAPQVEAYLSA